MIACCIGVGRDIEVHSRIQQLKTTVWLAEQYPLSLQEQILPVIELMVSALGVVTVYSDIESARVYMDV